MNAETAVTEDELQAFVDDRLDPAARERVLQHLARNPEEARRLEDYRRQRLALRAALGPIAEEPIPARLDPARQTTRRSVLQFPRRDRRSWRQAASPLARAAAVGLVCLAAGGTLGYRAARPVNPFFIGVRPLAEEAADSYSTYAVDRLHPVEVAATDMPALTSWVSSRLGKRVDAPAVADGLELLGGRVVPTSRGPAAMFMYTDKRGRQPPAVLLVCPLSLHGSAPMVEGSDADLTSFTWSEHGVGYSLIGKMPAAELRTVADDMRRAFGRDT